MRNQLNLIKVALPNNQLNRSTASTYACIHIYLKLKKNSNLDNDTPTTDYNMEAIKVIT